MIVQVKGKKFGGSTNRGTELICFVCMAADTGRDSAYSLH